VAAGGCAPSCTAVVPMTMMPICAAGTDTEAFKKLKAQHSKLQKDNARLKAEHAVLQNQVGENAEHIATLTAWVQEMKAAKPEDVPSYRSPMPVKRAPPGSQSREPYSAGELSPNGGKRSPGTNMAAGCITMEPVGTCSGRSPPAGGSGRSPGSTSFTSGRHLTEDEELAELRGAFGSAHRDGLKGKSPPRGGRLQMTNSSLSRVWVAGEAYDNAGKYGGNGYR